MKVLSWRDAAAPIIAETLRATAGQNERSIVNALYLAYPFGERAMQPYKAWCAEVKRQRGIAPVTALHRKQLAMIEAHNLDLRSLDLTERQAK
jgi:hypothetical protein